MNFTPGWPARCPCGAPRWPQHPGQCRLPSPGARSPAVPPSGRATRDPQPPPWGWETTANPGPGAGKPQRAPSFGSCPAASRSHRAADLNRAALGARSGHPGAGRARSARSLRNTRVCKPIFCFIPREQVFQSAVRESAEDARLGFHPVPHVH